MGNTHSVEDFENIKKEFYDNGVDNCRMEINKHSIVLLENNFLNQNFKFTKDKKNAFQYLANYYAPTTKDSKQYVYEYGLSIYGKKGLDDVEISLKIKLMVEEENGYWCVYNPFETFHPIRFEYKKNNQNCYFWYMNVMHKIEAQLLENIPYTDVMFDENIVNFIEQYISHEKALLYPTIYN